MFQTSVAIVPCRVPLLLSRPTLSALGLVYDLASQQASFSKLGIESFPLEQSSSGHPAVPIDQFCGDKPPADSGRSDLLVWVPERAYMVHGVMSGEAVVKEQGFKSVFFPKKIAPEVQAMLEGGPRPWGQIRRGGAEAVARARGLWSCPTSQPPREPPGGGRGGPVPDPERKVCLQGQEPRQTQAGQLHPGTAQGEAWCGWAPGTRTWAWLTWPRKLRPPTGTASSTEFLRLGACSFDSRSAGYLGAALEIVKGVFGLSTSPKLWWLKLSGDLKGLTVAGPDEEIYVVQNPIDPCVFMPVGRESNRVRGLLLTHVDDLLLMTEDQLREPLQTKLKEMFPVDD